MSHFLQNEPDITSQKIAIQEKLEGEEHDLAKAMLNNNARNSISEKAEDQSRDTTTSSSTADTLREKKLLSHQNEQFKKNPFLSFNQCFFFTRFLPFAALQHSEQP